MIWFSLLLLGILVLVFFRRRRLPRSTLTAAALLALAGLVTAGFQLFSHPEKRAAQKRLVSMSEAIGVRIGRVLTEELPPGGKVLVLHSGASAYLNTAKDELEGFLAGIRRAIAEKQIEVLSYVPNLAREDRMIFASDYLPAEVLQHALRDHPDARAYVSLLGAPFPDVRSLPAGLPPIYAVNVYNPEMARPLLRQGVVRAIVFPRPDAHPLDPRARRMTPEEIFDARFNLERTPGS